VPAALVQKAKGHSNLGNATFSVSFPGAVTPGNTVLVLAHGYSGIQSADSISDNQGGGTYAKDCVAPADGHQFVTNIGLYRRFNVTASGTFTVTYTVGATAANPNLYVMEWSGVTAVDGSNITYSAGADMPIVSGPLTPSQASDLFIACYAAGGFAVAQTPSLSPNPDGFTVGDFEDDGSTYMVGGWAYLIAADSAAKQTTWIHAGGAGTNDGYASMTAYSGGPPPPPPQQLRPDADLATTGWSTAPLWSKIDEASAGGDVISAVSA
jgi:hypothetical protein